MPGGQRENSGRKSDKLGKRGSMTFSVPIDLVHDEKLREFVYNAIYDVYIPNKKGKK